MMINSSPEMSFLGLFLSLCFGVCSCLKIRYLDVPQVAQSGHDVSLTCDYDLERQRLYSVKWYKGSHEFYRFTPGDPEKLRLFLVENLHIDVHRSNERSVHLKDLHVDMTGTYTCEVSTETVFETVSAQAEMTVVALPRGGPHIQGYSPGTSARIGDNIMLNCTSLKSKPAAKLEFFINGKKVSGRRSISLEYVMIVDEEDKPQTVSSILSMHFKIRRHHIKNGKMTIRCEASIFNTYRRDKEVQFFVETHTAAANLSNHNGGGALIRRESPLLLLMLGFLQQLSNREIFHSY